MLIKRLTVRDYRSLKEINIENLTNFNVFVGANDSGKSNILKAIDLFFNWCDSKDIKGLIQSGLSTSALSFSGRTENVAFFHGQKPGKVELTAHLAIDEKMKSLLPESFVMHHLKGQEFTVPTVTSASPRELTANPSDTKEILRKSLGDEIIVSEEIKSDGNTMEGNVSWITWGDLYVLRPTEEKLRWLDSQDGKQYTYRQSASGPQSPVSKLIEALRSTYVLVPAVRELIGEKKTVASALSDGKNVPSQYLRYEKDVSVNKQDTYRRVRGYVSNLFPEYENTASMTNEKTEQVDVHFQGFPSASVGDGVKNAFLICFDVGSHLGSICGIEEPEIHFHPAKQRQLHRFLVERSLETQIFVTTHSPTISSMTRLTDLRLVTIDPAERITDIKPVDSETVSDVIRELGVRPSDFFDYDVIAFVEGPADVGVFEEIANKIRPGHSASFFSTDGWTNMQYYANVDVLASKRFTVLPFLIFDGDTKNLQRNKKTMEYLMKKISLPTNQVVTLTKNSIEDYILVPRAIREAFPELQADENEINKFLNEHLDRRNKKKVLAELFRNHGLLKYREIDDARKIVKAMTKNEIDYELVNIVESLSKIAGGS
jgi:hypothetical protein